MELRRRALELLLLNDPAKKAAATRGLFDSRAALALDAGAAIEAPPSLPGRPPLPRLAPHTALARRSPFTREGSVGEKRAFEFSISCEQVSIETVQSQLDCSVLAQLDKKQIMVGCVDLSSMAIETPEVIAASIRRALPFVAKESVILAPDRGMKYLAREVAVGKLRSMVEAAKLLRTVT